MTKEAFFNLIKSTEGAIVIGGCLAGFFFGGFWSLATAAAYTLFKLPALYTFIKDTITGLFTK